MYQFPIDEAGSKQYLDDIYSSILKNIAQRNIVKYLKNEKRSISLETLYNYIDYCRTACLLHLVSREDVIGKKVLQFQEKIYFTDHGIREEVYGNNLGDINQTLENVV